MKLTAEYANSVLDYNPETGTFLWKQRPREHFKTEGAWSTWNSRYAGKESGTTTGKDGYRAIIIDYRGYLAHRLAWLMVYGKWPSPRIDHIDMNRTDNRIENLREATHGENLCNRGAQKNNTSGLKGVGWCKDRQKWRAQIKLNSKTFSLGRFDCPAAASFAYQIAADKLHGKFARAK